MRLRDLTLIAVAALLAAPASAGASQLITRNATHPHLIVDRHGRALVSYRKSHRAQHVLAWGAINARPPSRSRKQVEFRLDYAGGYGHFHRAYWKTMRNSCRPYHPRLHWLVTACTARDGSHWALQEWRRLMPNGGYTRFHGEQGKRELQLSHWSGPLPRLWLKTDWVKVRTASGAKEVDHLFGQLSYRGRPVHGFRNTRQGNPLDGYGRNIYLDTLNSPWGRGWRRLNSFLTHDPHGNFCAFAGRLWGHRTFGMGSAYRAGAMGPGVTPVVFWQGAAPGRYDESLDARRNAENKRLAGSPRDHCWSR